jgi:hypothetical protein
MPKRNLLEERPASIASGCVDRFKKRMKCPSLGNIKNVRTDVRWTVEEAPVLPYLYIPQRTSAVVKNMSIEDVTARIEYCEQTLCLVGNYDSLNAKATFSLNDTTFTVQIFSSFEKEDSKICFIVELLRIKGPMVVFHNVAIFVLNAVRQDNASFRSASDQEQLESLQKKINLLQL